MAKKVTAEKTVKKRTNAEKSPSAKSVTLKNTGTSEEGFRRRIRDIIRAQGRDPAPLALTIEMAGSALHWWSCTKFEISRLDSYTVKDISKYGEKVKRHPLFEVASMAMDEARSNLKMLGLTFEDVVNRDRDEMDEFDAKINE
jgi:hypothetical protein